MPDIPYGTDYPEQPWIDEDGNPIPDEDHPQSLLSGMVNGTWLDSQDFPPLEYAVKGIIPEGFGLLVGPPKAGKSWLVAAIGLSVAAGGKALGGIPVTQRPVLYLALEDGHRRLQSRFRRITSDEPIPAGIHVIISAQSHQVVPMIQEFLQRHHDRQPLVILDTLGKVKPPKRPGEDSYSTDYAIGSRLKAAIDAVRGASLVVVHHTRKAESTDFVDAVSGTQGIAGSADFVIVLARKRHSDDAVLSVTGRDISEDEYALVCDEGLWRLDGDTLAASADKAKSRRDEGHLGDRALEVLSLVNSRNETRAADLSALNINQEQGRVYLNRLVDSGRIRKLGRGVYGPNTVTTVTTVTSGESSQVTDIAEEEENVTPLKASVTSEGDGSPTESGNVTVITDITPEHSEDGHAADEDYKEPADPAVIAQVVDELLVIANAIAQDNS